MKEKKGYKTISISEIEAARRRRERESIHSGNLHAFYGVTAPLSHYPLADSFLYSEEGVKWHGIIGGQKNGCCQVANLGRVIDGWAAGRMA